MPRARPPAGSANSARRHRSGAPGVAAWRRGTARWPRGQGCGAHLALGWQTSGSRLLPLRTGAVVTVPTACGTIGTSFGSFPEEVAE